MRACATHGCRRSWEPLCRSEVAGRGESGRGCGMGPRSDESDLDMRRDRRWHHQYIRARLIAPSSRCEDSQQSADRAPRSPSREACSRNLRRGGSHLKSPHLVFTGRVQSQQDAGRAGRSSTSTPTTSGARLSSPTVILIPSSSSRTVMKRAALDLGEGVLEVALARSVASQTGESEGANAGRRRSCCIKARRWSSAHPLVSSVRSLVKTSQAQRSAWATNPGNRR